MPAIDKYEAAWHPDKNRGVIVIHPKGGSKKQWTIPTAPEFLAMLQILQRDTDVFLTDSGWITTGKEDPGTS